MEEQNKKKLKSVVRHLAEIIAASSVVIGVLAWIFTPHIDTFLKEKMDALMDSSIRVGIIVKNDKEIYVAPDGHEYQVIHGEDGRYWYDNETKEMELIYF